MDVCEKKSVWDVWLFGEKKEIDGDDWWAEACSLLSSDGGCSSAEAGTRRDAAEGGTTACDSMMACAAEPITVDGVEGDLLRAVVLGAAATDDVEGDLDEIDWLHLGGAASVQPALQLGEVPTMRDLLANAPTPPDVIQSAGTFAEHTG